MSDDDSDSEGKSALDGLLDGLSELVNRLGSLSEDGAFIASEELGRHAEKGARGKGIKGVYGVTVRFVEFSHLVGDIKAGFDAGRGSHTSLDPLVRVDVLVIDELGKGRNTEFEGTVVDELVSRRYNAAGTILATTNYAPGAATGKAAPNFASARPAAPSLADRVGDRVYSRLREMSDFVPCDGPDWRELKRGRTGS